MRKVFLAAAAMLASAAPASAKWREASSSHFVIYSEGSEASLRDFATRLERFDGAMRWLRGLDEMDLGPANRIVVYVVSDIEKVRRIYGDRSGQVAGFYIPRAGHSLAIIPRRLDDGSEFDMTAEIVLLHEYAHHFMYQNYPSLAYPAWFSEGFAEFNSVARFDSNGDVGLGLPAMHRAHGLARERSLSIEELIAPDFAKLSGYEQNALYSMGWLLTHMLTVEPSRAGQLSAYLEALNGGKSGTEAAVAAFGDLAALKRDLSRYMKRSRMSYFHVKADNIRVGKIAVRELSPAEDAIMDVKIQSRRGVNEAEAKALLPLARKAAARFPHDAAAQSMLAEAEFDAGNLAEAEAAADRAVAADPKAIDALIYKGHVKIAAAVAAKTDTAWKEARRWLLAANRVDPRHPQPLLLFYNSFAEQGIKPTANAVAALLEAHDLAPQDRNVRMLAARQLLIDGKTKEARATLAPIAFDPHSGKMGKTATSIIAAIDGSGASAALQAWNAASTEPEESDPS